MKVQRLRSLSLEQLMEEPESMEKQIALQDKEAMGRPEALESKRRMEVGPQAWPNFTPLGPQGDGGTVKVKSEGMGGGSHLNAFEKGIESWTRYQNMGDVPVAFEIQSHDKLSPAMRPESEQAAVEAFLRHVLNLNQDSVGLADPGTAAFAQQHKGIRPHIQRKYGDEFPSLFEQYTGQSGEPVEYFEPLTNEQVERNLRLMPLLNLKKSIDETIKTAPEYTRYFADPALRRGKSGPWYGYEGWESLDDEQKKQNAIWDLVLPSNSIFGGVNATQVGSDTNYGRTIREGYRYELSKVLDQIKSIQSLPKEKKDSLIKDTKSYWDMITDPYKYGIQNEVVDKYTSRPKPADLIEQKRASYQKYSLEDLKNILESGQNPWKYIKD